MQKKNSLRRRGTAWEEADKNRHRQGRKHDKMSITVFLHEWLCMTKKPTWPPVSGFPKTSFCPKKPCGDRMTTLNMFGILDRKSKSRTESGASNRCNARFMVSFARATELPQPGSKPSNCKSSETSEHGICKHREAVASRLKPLGMESAGTEEHCFCAVKAAAFEFLDFLVCFPGPDSSNHCSSLTWGCGM